MTTTKKIICLAVDDEPPALDIIQKYIELIPSLQLTGTCSNAVEALEILRNQVVDLIFLDIQMPQILGTDFVRALKNPPKVIFTTAFRKFAVEGFELDAVDYLLKPISFERFLKAVNKVMQTSLAVTYPSLTEEENANDPFIHFRSDRRTLKVLLNDILFIESLKDYIKVVTKAKSIVTKQSMSSVENNLSARGFVRIHRSYIVAVNKIESYTNEFIQIGKEELPISRSYRHEVEKALSNNMII